MPALENPATSIPLALPPVLAAARRAIPADGGSELVLDLSPDTVQVVLTPAGPYSRRILAAVEQRTGRDALAVVAEHQPLFWHWLIAPTTHWTEAPGRTFRFAHGTLVLPPLTRTGPPGTYWIRTPGSSLLDPAVLREAVRETEPR
ncbi:hypothetical protein [Streptomyces sp. cg36]|uniref:hypothetical protein n=1 Tax=Streptomyces sp. cg36 TaxID=3238798 RepID=UPI0034E27AA2